MCYAHLQTCTRCAWLVSVTYPRCSHAKAYYLAPPACPMRMERRYVARGVCRVCRAREWEAPVYECSRARTVGVEGGREGGKGGEMGARRLEEGKGKKKGIETVGEGEDEDEDEYKALVKDGEGESESDASDDGPPVRYTRPLRARRERNVRAATSPAPAPTPLRTSAAQHERPCSPPSPTIAQIIEQEAAQRKRRTRCP